ncbi:hypothetical protein KFL_010770020 [Klebsormidium nitens]|uniref:PROP1-like PPR domain-containing protein n=1 Tax=Klebsormidium nitens TaxID=105231 RepID=A0A1Y1ISV8_KLENI|nr:hypothetical protein KFL_010770020 [Klebsormidium nitens]|eukprot:GAQ92629.1 hypothetical protein KFL_010770020 [Klebsormidium nitens]
MRVYLADGGAKKPWDQMVIEQWRSQRIRDNLHTQLINPSSCTGAQWGTIIGLLLRASSTSVTPVFARPLLANKAKDRQLPPGYQHTFGALLSQPKAAGMRLAAFLREDVGSRHALFDCCSPKSAPNGNNSEDEREDGVRLPTVSNGLRVVDSMVSIGLRPTRIGMEALIDCCDAALDAEMAEGIVRRMEEEYGLPPTIVTLVRLLRACVNAEDEDRALRVLDRLPREDLKTVDMQLFVMQTLLLQYEEAAESREAAEAPGSMLRLRMKLDELLFKVPVTSTTALSE